MSAFWIAIAVAGMALVFFTAWPLYNTYRSRRTGGDYAAKDVAEAQAYFNDKAKGDLAQAAADQTGQGHPGTQDTDQPTESDPAAPPSRG